MNCPHCNREGFDADFTDDSYLSILTGIVDIQIECPLCGAVWYGKIEFDFEDLEMSLEFIKEDESNRKD